MQVAKGAEIVDVLHSAGTMRVSVPAEIRNNCRMDEYDEVLIKPTESGFRARHREPGDMLIDEDTMVRNIVEVHDRGSGALRITIPAEIRDRYEIDEEDRVIMEPIERGFEARFLSELVE